MIVIQEVMTNLYICFLTADNIQHCATVIVDEIQADSNENNKHKADDHTVRRTSFMSRIKIVIREVYLIDD